MTTAILLAAGHSRRFGRDKPTFTFGGESLTQRCLRQAASAGIDQFVIVANSANQQLLREQADAIHAGQVTVRVQDGDEAPASVLTGLAATTDDDDVLLCCTNDLVPDDTITRILAASHADPGLTVTTTLLKWVFTGGMLDLDDQGRLRRIIEKPPGGCPPGAAVNIFLHRYVGASLITELTATLARTRDYEAAVNELLQHGLTAHAVPVDRWVGVKDRYDIQRARQEFADQLV